MGPKITIVSCITGQTVGIIPDPNLEMSENNHANTGNVTIATDQNKTIAPVWTPNFLAYTQSQSGHTPI